LSSQSRYSFKVFCFAPEVILKGQLGRGTYGTVKDGVWPERFGDKRLAVKIPKMSPQPAHLREVAALEIMGGAPGVAPLLASLPPGPKGEREAIVMPHCGESIERLVNRFTGVSADALYSVTRQLVRALAYAEQRGIIHRDVSEGNILFSGRADPVLTLCDWGLSCSADAAECATVPASDYVTALWFRAPELVLGGTVYDGRVDVWSAGVVLASVASGIGTLPMTKSSVETQRHLANSFLQMYGWSEENWGWVRSERYPRSVLLNFEPLPKPSSPRMRIESLRRAHRMPALASTPKGEAVMRAICAALTPDPSKRPTATELLRQLVGGVPPTAFIRPAAPVLPVASSEEWDRLVDEVVKRGVVFWSESDRFVRRARRRRALRSALQ